MICAGGDAFVDHLSLLKLSGKWMIVHKTFAGRPLHDELSGTDAEAFAVPSPVGSPPDLMADYASAAKTIQRYLTAIHTKDPEPLRPYFRGTLKGMAPDGSGEMITRSATEFCDGIAIGPPVGHPVEPCTDQSILQLDRILALEQTSPNTILAKVQVATPFDARVGKPMVYTDFLSLLQVKDDDEVAALESPETKWIVASKCWAACDASAPFAGYGYIDNAGVSSGRQHNKCSCFLTLWQTIDAHCFTGFAQIAAALEHYIVGGSTAPSGATLRKVFHPSTVLQGAANGSEPGAADGQHIKLEGEAFLRSIDSHAGQSVDTKGHKFNKIVKIDKAGENVACATVQVAAGGQIYTDHLSMLNIQNKWSIVHKTFAGKPLSE
eukprot:SAG31_NODE_2645_length_5313_cov_6.731300_2_plen_380_part_00